MVVQFVPSLDVWIWKALPYAVSQFRTTWVMVWVAPRSTCSHCGSLKALDQRVERFPSTAFEAGYPACTDEAVAGCPWDSRVPVPPDPVGVACASLECAEVPALLLAVTV